MYFAHSYLSNLKESDFLCRNHFLAGSLVPDAVHARQPFNRDEKKRAHFKQGFRDTELYSEENLAEVLARLEEYFKDSRQLEKEEFSYHLGYICHIYTDLFFIVHLRQSIIESCAHGLNKKESQVTAHDIYEVLDGLDSFADQRFETHDQVIEEISRSNFYSIGDLISKEEAEISRKWVLDRSEKKDYQRPLPYMDPKKLEPIFEQGESYLRNQMAKWIMP